QPISGYYSCGYYSSGAQNPSSFVRVYGSAGSSDYGQADQTFINDEIGWVQTAYSTMHGAGIKVMINHPPVAATPSGNELTLLQSVDGVVDENGFSLYGQYGPDSHNPGDFSNSLSWVQAVQNMGKAVFLTDYYNCQYVPANCSATSASQLSNLEVDWAASTYAIANNGGLGLFVAPQGVGEYSFRPELTTRPYGAPCGSATQTNGLYVRKFANGLAIVNASTSSQNYTLPNHAYTDVEQNAHNVPGPGGILSLGAADGAVLLVTDGSNGCS
ncbi:MAG: hypothetical protein ACREMT_09630, partial [Vulcanimicrobiaceae bacterium]